jgi:hypothetical protein
MTCPLRIRAQVPLTRQSLARSGRLATQAFRHIQVSRHVSSAGKSHAHRPGPPTLPSQYGYDEGIRRTSQVLPIPSR